MPDSEQVRADVASLLNVLSDGGVGIVPLDVAYAICASRADGIERIFAAKQRSYEKPSGMLGNAALSRAIHCMDDWKHGLVEQLINVDGIPFSVVAPFATDHPMFASVEPFVMRNSSKQGTLDMLLNAGVLHDEIAVQSASLNMPVFGSSANASLSGSKYNLLDIDEPVRNAADICFDYGQSKYANKHGRSSTIIDFRNFAVVREGVIFADVCSAFARHGIVLQSNNCTAR